MKHSYPLQAQPDGWLHVLVVGMQASPHAFPVVQTLQHDGPDELLQAVVRGGPLAAASVSASAAERRKFFQIHRNPFMAPARAEITVHRA